MGENSAEVLGFGSVVVPVLDEVGAMEMNAGAAVDAVGVACAWFSKDCRGSEEAGGVAVWVEVVMLPAVMLGLASVEVGGGVTGGGGWTNWRLSGGSGSEALTRL